VSVWLPNVNQAQIHPDKLTYLLTTGKARFFTVHGFDPRHPAGLEDALRAHPEVRFPSAPPVSSMT
jgi:hypothetical protein